MMTVLLLSFTILFFLFLYVYYKFVYIFNKNLEHFPTPPATPILGHALDFFSGREFFDVLMDYINTYGDVVRLKTGPKRQLLLISNYDYFEFFLSTKKLAKRSMDYKFFHRWLGSCLLTADGYEWRKRRRLITPAFSQTILENFIDTFNSNASMLVEKFGNHLDRSSIDIYPFMNLCTLDIICESVMGTSIGAQQNSNLHYVQSVENMLRITMERIFSPHKMFDWIYFFTKDYKKERKALNILHGYTRNVIQRRQHERELEKDFLNTKEKKKKVFLDLLLEENDGGGYLTMEQIREEVDGFMFAGHDTSAFAISVILYCLANHPDEQNKVFIEQKEIFGDDFERPATSHDLINMKYLELVIKESLRIYPPAPFFSRELDMDILYDGITFPKGLTLTFCVYALHRNAKYFSQPAEFLPDRFNTDNGKLPMGYIPFGIGPRNCIGQKFAMLEMKSVVSRVIRTFDLLPSIPPHQMKVGSQILLTSTNGFCIRFKRRN